MKNYKRYRGNRPRSSGSCVWRAVLILLLVCVLVYGSLLAVVVAGEHDEITGEPEIMIVLGCSVLESGQPSPVLKDRLDEALSYLEDHSDMIVVVTGGKGHDGICSEAECMANYLIANGVPTESVLLEDQATSTWENLVYSYDLLSRLGYEMEMEDVLLVSSGFHLTRARMLFDRAWEGEYDLSTLAAPVSHLPSRLKHYVREPLVMVKSFLFDRG